MAATPMRIDLPITEMSISSPQLGFLDAPLKVLNGIAVSDECDSLTELHLERAAKLRQECARLAGENARLLAMQQAWRSPIFPAPCELMVCAGPPGLDLKAGRSGSTDLAWDSATCAPSSDADGSDTESCDSSPQPQVSSPCMDSMSDPSDCTTVIMRNVPNRHTRNKLVTLLDDCGFNGAYDLVYLPIDFATGVSLGYAFVNLVSMQEKQRFLLHFQGFSEWGSNSKKVCKVISCEESGGLDACVNRYRNMSVMHSAVPDEYKPALYRLGQRMPFPAPTKRVRNPRTQGFAGKCEK